MNISYKWLKSLIDFDLAPQELAEKLTLIGHEVDELRFLGEAFEGLVVGRAEGIREHPGADKLKLVEVNCGAALEGGASIEVVCGAPNVKVGGLYPMAQEGAVLPGGFKIKRAKIRGVESRGMLCSERELGLSEEASGLMELDPGLAPGTPLAEVLGRDDWLVAIDVTANRGDMWSHLGAARELQQFTGSKAVLPGTAVKENLTGARASVTIEDPQGCPRYIAWVIEDVTVGPSPNWLIERLEAVGQRSINNIVDVTNYILFELGQPLHAFDLDKLEENRIVVRKAREGEMVRTLDGVERKLDAGMTIIADAVKPVAVAGVMGDELTEVDKDTKRVLLECAYFDPATNRRTSKALGLMTEASKRFERGTDYSMMEYAAERAADLIAEHASGVIRSPVTDVYPSPFPDFEITLRTSRVRQVLGVGVDFSETEIRKLLEGVDFIIEKEQEGLYRVKVPACRRLDVTEEIDLIEELARLWGYDRIPVPGRMDITPESSGTDRYSRESAVRRALSGIGLQEIMTSAFVGYEYVERIYGPGQFDPLGLQSPISSEEDVLRPSLLPSMLSCIKRNLNQGNKD
ncbi:MAG: phenylalanine--tRNA ligase subunit beta, partial [Gemmatimonadota bacterium]|nr:phenylalanine--tRNA ligase subunit beta [Gemmatimonadota bacterium]